jgi:DNA-directed RNA polymerase subunit RPC12/RpoP
MAGVDLDKGGEIECPACGHKFVIDPRKAECPECGLGLGAAGESAPDEAEQR